MTVYQHYKNGKTYYVIDEVTIKVEAMKIPGYAYVCADNTDKKFVRSVDDFKMKFEAIEIPEDTGPKYRCVLKYKDGRQEIDHVTPDYDQDNNEYIPFEIEIGEHWFQEAPCEPKRLRKCLTYIEVDRR